MLKHDPFVLQASGLAKSYGSKHLWQDLSFEIPAGTLTALTGPSGCGKTTLLNCLGMLESLDTGTINYGPYTYSAQNRRPNRACFRDTLGFLFQNYGLVENWNVEQNLKIATQINPNLSRRTKAKTAISAALERVGMSGSEKAKTYTLSGGEQQRVALARLILKAPSVILADEPTSALDQDNAALVMELLKEQAHNGALIIISTHSPEIADHCDQNLNLPTADKIVAS